MVTLTQHISVEFLKKNQLEPAIIWKLVTCQWINYLDLDKTRVKLFPNFTRHHLITHTKETRGSLNLF